VKVSTHFPSCTPNPLLLSILKRGWIGRPSMYVKKGQRKGVYSGVAEHSELIELENLPQIYRKE